MIRKFIILYLIALLLFVAWWAVYYYWHDDIADKIELLFGAGNISVALRALVAFLPIVLLMPAMRVSVEYSRSSKRMKLGLCLRCGYDLRGSKERCPECGRPLEAA